MTKQILVPDLTLRPYQIPFFKAMDSGLKRAVLVHHRRAGKEIICWNYMIRQAICDRVGTYCYFFPTSRLGKRILWDGANKEGKRFIDYIPKEVIKSENSVEMKIELTNGSVIQIMGTDTIINVGINPVGCVFSEFSLQDPKSWSFIRPIMRENGGWAVFNGCVVKGTLVLGEEGLIKIDDVSSSREMYSDLNKPFYGLGGFHNADQFYSGGERDLLKITTKKGYEVECTPNHPLWNGSSWVRADEWAVEDYIPVQLDQHIFSTKPFDYSDWVRPVPKSGQGRWKSLGDDFISDDFFYLMGLYLAEGSMDRPKEAKGGKITVTNTDPEIISFLNNFGFTTQKDGIHHTFCGTEIQSFFEWFGMGEIARNKTIPNRLLKCEKSKIIAFLQGYFDGDGTAGKIKYGYIKATSASEELLKTLQVLLLTFGIVSRRSSGITPPTKRVKKECVVHNLEVEGNFAARFWERIGFRLKRKQERYSLVDKKIVSSRGDIVPVDPSLIGYKLPKALATNPKRISYRLLQKINEEKRSEYLSSLLQDGFYWDKIKKIEPSNGEVFDFVIPDTHSFFSNGLVSHNTPRGKNHFYDMYMMARDNPEWFCQKLTVRDTDVVSEADIQKERDEGMSENLIQQEYYTNFDQGSDGAFYGKHLAMAEAQGRLTNVPYDPYMPVDTFWDLGVSDSTTIIFVQNIGQEIHIIDSYTNEGEGLDHYARVIKKKAAESLWQYGAHFAPHDIRVRELGHGAKTRLEMARDLGLDFEIVPNLSIHEGIEMARAMFHKLWIDRKTCSYLIKCIENYHRSFNERLNVYSDKPVHNWASNYADAFRYMAIIQNKRRTGVMTEESANDLERLYAKRY